MSDNTQLNLGSGGDIAASDDIGGVKYQRLKLTLGADGVNDGDVASGNPLPVTASSLPLPSGAATEATLDARTGALTETAPTTDTASSGLNGRLQRIAQRLTSLIALLPAALGAGGGLKVDGSGTALPVKDAAASSSTISNVASSASNVTLLASNSNRRGATFYNDSTQNCYVKLGATATASSFSYLLVPGQTLELPAPIYTGIVDGIWASANGSMRVTEFA